MVPKILSSVKTNSTTPKKIEQRWGERGLKFPSMEEEGRIQGKARVGFVLLLHSEQYSTAQRRDSPPHVRLLTFCMVAHSHLLRRGTVILLHSCELVFYD
jgi:hypothetical protein